MAHAHTQTKKNPKSPALSAQDALALLSAEHAKEKKMVRDFGAVNKIDGSNDANVALRELIWGESALDLPGEDENIYPAVCAAIEAEDLWGEADDENAEVTALISRLGAMETEGDR